jgi:hypothetical protein
VSKIWPGHFAGARRESGEMAAAVGERRERAPSRLRCDASQGPSTEYVRHSGEIAARSRTLLKSPGYEPPSIRRLLPVMLIVPETCEDEPSTETDSVQVYVPTFRYAWVTSLPLTVGVLSPKFQR